MACADRCMRQSRSPCDQCMVYYCSQIERREMCPAYAAAATPSLTELAAAAPSPSFAAEAGPDELDVAASTAAAACSCLNASAELSPLSEIVFGGPSPVLVHLSVTILDRVPEPHALKATTSSEMTSTPFFLLSTPCCAASIRSAIA